MYVYATKDLGTFYRGDEITFNMFIVQADSANGWPIPDGSTISVGLLGENGPITTTDVVVFNTNGGITVKFPASNTGQVKVGQPTIVVVVSKDTAAWTFEVRAPFTVKARSLVM